jgi:hypothetical protein
VAAVEITGAVTAQKKQEYLAALYPLRPRPVLVNAEVLAGQRQDVAGIDPLEDAHRLKDLPG